jgi:hypothetical protein
LQFSQRVTELVGAGGQSQLFGSQPANALAVHGQAGSTGCGHHTHGAGGFQLFKHGGGNGFNFGHHQGGAFLFDQAFELRRVAHGDGARVVCHLVAGGVVVAVNGNGLHAQALQRDQYFFAQFASAQ